MIKSLLVALVLLALAGCASQQERLGEWSQSNGSKIEVVQTSSFQIQTVTPSHFSPGKRLTVFIEGDGHAWATSTQPSLDPTPHTFAFADLAMQGHPGIYLARPCQFVQSKSCDKSLWTDARFSKVVVDSVNQAISQLKARYKASEVELIGYSGGAAIALLVASERDDITQLQTIAGNVDPAAWVALKGLSALSRSMNTLAHPEKLSLIPQRHFVGASDRTIPKALVEGFVGKISARCAEIVDLGGDHASIVQGITPKALNRPITCRYR